MHAAHQIIGLEHAAHGVGQAQRDSHGQTFGYGNDNERHGNHNGLQQVGDEVDKGKPPTVPPKRGIVRGEEHDDANHHD